jgi:hypothetical protein
MSWENIQQLDSASIQSLTSKTLTIGNVTSSIFNGIVVAGIISSGEPTASYDGEVRIYQQGINLYVSLKSDSIIGKAGLYRSPGGFFNYYDLNTGDTNLDTVFGGSSIILRIAGNKKLKIDNNGNTQVTGSLFVSNGITASINGTSSYSLSSRNGASAWAFISQSGTIPITSSYGCRISRISVGTYGVIFTTPRQNSTYVVNFNGFSGSANRPTASIGYAVNQTINGFTMSISQVVTPLIKSDCSSGHILVHSL